MTSTQTKKIIAVVGATGLQGSSVAQTFLSLPDWHVRCLTRNPSSEPALKLASNGAEVVQADLGDLESLTKAFANASAIFLNLGFGEKYRALMMTGAGAEVAGQEAYEESVLFGKNAVIAAAGVPTLERLVYSTLASAKIGSGGKYSNSMNLESKHTILEYIMNEQRGLAKKTSLIILGCYFTNRLLIPRRDPRSGGYGFIWPGSDQVLMPLVDPSEATGPFVRALVEDEGPGTRLLAYNSDSYLAIKEIFNLWSKRTGKESSVMKVDVATMEQVLGVPSELSHMVAFVAEFGYTNGMDNVIEPKDLKKAVSTVSFEEWLGRRDITELLPAENSES
ncbi:hypothetical protein BX600DRAFT_500093 [Xylariales sp. PMI_506]|nr:hypothetical protein BX600DRAFT_500093 [Xylariales sp. PMI_506]